MFKFIYIIILLTLMLLVIFLLNRLRQRTTNELEKVLYIQNKPELYLELLKNPRLKILYAKSTLLQFELNAYFLLGNNFEIERIINLLDTMPMAKGQALEYNQKKLSYYCSQGEKRKAQASLNKIEEILSKAKGNHVQAMLKESKLIFDIYINHDTKLIKELEQIQSDQQGAIRGLTLYRLAKLCYFDKNNRKAQEYLNEARSLLQGTAWFDIATAAALDMNVLNYK